MPDKNLDALMKYIAADTGRMADWLLFLIKIGYVTQEDIMTAYGQARTTDLSQFEEVAAEAWSKTEA